MLDFPGYRGRLAVADIGQVRKQLKDDQVDPVAQLLLRGKVAYLFERYTDDQEMNLLVLCAPSNKQSDVKDLGPVLETWVHSTQGADAVSRARRKPGLIWALTMFDQRLTPAPGQTEDLMRKGWEGMMKLTLLERFGAYNWLHEWAPGRPFDNLFLVRKPRMAAAVIETDKEREQRLIPDKVEWLNLLRRTFCAEPTVQKHLADPGAAWDAMLALNDGGITRLAEYLDGVASPENKRARIAEQLDAIADDLVRHRFAAFYQQEGAAEVEGKQRLAERVLDALKPRASRFAELLGLLQPSHSGLRALYLRADDADTAPADAATTSAPTPAPATTGGGGLIDLDAMLSAPPPSASAADASSSADTAMPRASSSSSRFVTALLRFWTGQLKALPEDATRMAHLGIARDALDDLTGELVTAIDRLGLENELIAVIDEGESQTAAKRSRLAERQVSIAHARIARFVDYLGCDDIEIDARPRSRLDPRHGVFEPPPIIPADGLPTLPATQVNYSAQYILDWFEAFRALAVANAGHAAGREIAPEQNARLGAILERIDGTAGAAA